MQINDLRMGVGIWSNRFGDPKVVAKMAKAMEDTGHIDQMVFWDQLNNWWPDALWEPSCTPLANLVPDGDSLADPFVACAFALAEVEKLGFVIATDAVRREPAELIQTMLTLAGATTGRATLSYGAGEVRHIAPFGRSRATGLKRLEDGLKVMRLLKTADKPVDHDGKVWKMKDAWLGNGNKDKDPEILAMGGGPRLINASVSDADGFSTGAPFVYGNAEKYGKAIEAHKLARAEAGVADQPYTYALHYIAFCCKDKEDFEQYIDNPLVRWFAATSCRINMNDLAEEGLESVLPLDWHYAFKMNPVGMTRTEVDAIIENVSPEMVRKTFFYGSPADIAAEIIPYVKKGANMNMVADLAPVMTGSDPDEYIENMAEICRLVKEGVS